MTIKETFAFKAITLTSEKFPDIEVTRSRNSNGFSEIRIKMKGYKGDTSNSQNMKIPNYEENGGTSLQVADHGEYEDRARELARLLMDVAADACGISEITRS